MSPPPALHRRGLVRRDELIVMGAPVPAGAAQAGGWLLDSALLAQRAARLAAAAAEYAAANPLELGMPLTTAQRLTAMLDPRLAELLLGSQLTLVNGRVHRAGSATGLPAAPGAPRLAELGLGTKQLAAVNAGELLKIARRDLPGSGRRRHCYCATADLPNPFTLSQTRQALDTTRRVAIPLLEHLANHGITRRLPDGTHELCS